jgi:hypothetical protein
VLFILVITAVNVAPIVVLVVMTYEGVDETLVGDDSHIHIGSY